ncbi:MAG: ABC transporter permease [Candidatus Bathyarchaeia archaeon]
MLRGIGMYSFMKFVAKKVVFYGFVAFVALNFAFFIPRITPGDPISRLIPPTAYVPGMNITAIREYYKKLWGMDKPLFPDQYLKFWGQVLTLDLGPRMGRQWPRPVAEAVMACLPYTFALVIPVLVVSFILGNWIGAKAAYMGGKWSELIYFYSVFSNRLPYFWLLMVLVFLLARQAKLFPPVYLEYPTWWDFDVFIKMLRYWFLPFLSLFIVYLGGWATGMRAMVIHEMDSGYVRYAEQLGFKKKKVMSYAQRNAILPQFTGINLYLNALIGETAIVEMIYAWPGIGTLLYDAVTNFDSPTIIGCFIILMIVITFGNFLVDVLYGFVDPRIRIGRG